MHLDLLALIKQSSAVVQIAGDRITWQNAAQAPKSGEPYVVITKTSGVIGMRHDGLSALNDERLQIDCFAPTFAQADKLRTEITDQICGKQGVTGTTDFRAILPNAPRDFTPVDSIHRCLADITVTWRPAPVSP